MRDRRALVELAFLLPVIGAILLLPPILGIFADRPGPGGLPLLLGYVFAVWLALIVASMVLTRALTRAPPAAAAPPGGEERS